MSLFLLLLLLFTCIDRENLMNIENKRKSKTVCEKLDKIYSESVETVGSLKKRVASLEKANKAIVEEGDALLEHTVAWMQYYKQRCENQQKAATSRVDGDESARARVERSRAEFEKGHAERGRIRERSWLFTRNTERAKKL